MIQNEMCIPGNASPVGVAEGEPEPRRRPTAAGKEKAETRNKAWRQAQCKTHRTERQPEASQRLVLTKFRLSDDRGIAAVELDSGPPSQLSIGDDRPPVISAFFRDNSVWDEDEPSARFAQAVREFEVVQDRQVYRKTPDLGEHGARHGAVAAVTVEISEGPPE